MLDTVERELKLVPVDERLLDVLAVVNQLGPFRATRRARELQRNSFFDSPSRALAHERVGFRRRRVQGERFARWTIKGNSKHVSGIASRSEIELQLDHDMPPGMALSTLRAAARSRGAVALAEAVDAALSRGGLPLPRPFVETDADRRIVDLVASERGWQLELALDRVRIVGHSYTELEIEAELKRGEEAALFAVRDAIEATGAVRESTGSKLTRAVAHINACDCAS